MMMTHPTNDITNDNDDDGDDDASADGLDGFEETLLHEASTGRILEGLNSNLFVVMNDGSLRTAGISEGAYPGSTREAVLRLAARERVARKEG